MLKKLLNTTNNSSLNKRKNLAKFPGNLCITVSFKTIQHGSSNVTEIFRHKDAAKQKHKKQKNANKQISDFFPLTCFLSA